MAVWRHIYKLQQMAKFKLPTFDGFQAKKIVCGKF